MRKCLIAIQDRIIVRPDDKEEVSQGGIIIPEAAQQRSLSGVVVATGPGRHLENGQIAKIQVKVGNKVWWTEYGGNKIKYSGTEHVVLRELDILAIEAFDVSVAASDSWTGED